MAGVGFSKPYFALYSNSGTTITYSSGAKVGKAVSADLSLQENSDNILYADNAPAESDKQFGGGTLTLTVDNLDASVIKALLGVQEDSLPTIEGVTTTGAKVLHYDERQTIPYVGFAAIQKKIVNNAVKYVAVMYNKVQFANINSAFETQGESISWQTAEITATLMRDDSTYHEWSRMTTLLDSENDAELVIKTWLDID